MLEKQYQRGIIFRICLAVPNISVSTKTFLYFLKKSYCAH